MPAKPKQPVKRTRGRPSRGNTVNLGSLRVSPAMADAIRATMPGNAIDAARMLIGEALAARKASSV